MATTPVSTQDVYHKGFMGNMIARIRRIVHNRIRKAKRSAIPETIGEYRGGSISQGENQRLKTELEAERNLINKFEEKKMLKAGETAKVEQMRRTEAERINREKYWQERRREEGLLLAEQRAKERRILEEKRLRHR